MEVVRFRPFHERLHTSCYVRSRFFVCPRLKGPHNHGAAGPRAFICYLFISGSNQHETPRLKRASSKEGILAGVLRRVVIFSKFVPLRQKSRGSMLRLPSANAAFVTHRRHQEKFVHILWYFPGSRLSGEILQS